MDRSIAVHLLWIICAILSGVYHAFASVHCYPAVTWRETADLLALVCNVYCDFATFLFCILGQVWDRCGTWLYRFLILAVFLTLSEPLLHFIPYILIYLIYNTILTLKVPVTTKSVCFSLYRLLICFRRFWSNSVDLDQTAHVATVWSGSHTVCIFTYKCLKRLERMLFSDVFVGALRVNSIFRLMSKFCAQNHVLGDLVLRFKTFFMLNSVER